jgi:nucleotide-binding universal stress UspA family protein
MFADVLAATDGSELSRDAVQAAVELARVHGAMLTLVTCSVPYETFASDPLASMSRAQYEGTCERVADERLEPGRRLAHEAGVRAALVPRYAEQPWLGILQAAEERGCDVIVMGSHGRSGLAGALLGSQTLKVLSNSTVPVLVCRARDAR